MMKKNVLSLFGNLMIYFVALGLMGSSFTKLLGEPNIIEKLSMLTTGDPIYIGIIEMICALVLALPPTRKIGILLSTAFLGGAIEAESQMGFPYLGIGLVLIMWLGYFFRNPEFFGVKWFYNEKNDEKN